MSQSRRADPSTRREAVMLLAAGAGLLRILLAQCQQPAVQVWLTDDQKQTPRRLRR